KVERRTEADVGGDRRVDQLVERAVAERLQHLRDLARVRPDVAPDEGVGREQIDIVQGGSRWCGSERSQTRQSTGSGALDATPGARRIATRGSRRRNTRRVRTPAPGPRHVCPSRASATAQCPEGWT